MEFGAGQFCHWKSNAGKEAKFIIFHYCFALCQENHEPRAFRFTLSNIKSKKALSLFPVAETYGLIHRQTSSKNVHFVVVYFDYMSRVSLFYPLHYGWTTYSGYSSYLHALEVIQGFLPSDLLKGLI